MFEKLKSAITKAINVSGDTSIFIGGDSGAISMMSENITESELIKHYKKSLYVFIGIDKIATVTSAVDFDLFKILNEEGEAEKVHSHEVLDLIYKPNENQTKTEFMRILTINLKLSGETFIRLVREGEKIVGMFNIRPDIVDVEFNDTGNGPELVYKVYTGGEILTFTNYEMVHIKFPDPENPLRGAGVLRPAFSRITSEQKAMELQKNTFANNGRPDGILSVKGLNSQEGTDKLKRKMKNTFAGKNKEERIAIISSEMTYQQVSLNAKDMDFMESLKFLRDDILAGLGVPKELVTMEDGGSLSGTGDRGMRIFLEFTIEPLIKLFVESLNERMITPFFDEDLLLKEVAVVPEDRVALLKEAIELKKAGIVSVNHSRALLGIEPEEGHDEITEPVANPFLQNAFRGRGYLYKKFMDKKALRTSVESLVGKEFLTVPTAEYRAKYSKAMNSVTDKNIELMERETKKYFREQKARVKEAIEALGDKESISVSEIFPLEKEATATKRLAMQVFPNMALRSGNAGLIPIKSFYEKVDEFTIDAELIQLIEERGILFATSVAGVTYDQISKLIAQGLINGDGRAVVARSIYEAFDEMTRVRAKRIAQTEGTNMSNLGLQEAFRKEELVTGKEWISSRDGNVRPEHQANDGQVVDKDVAFPNGELYPAHKSINCRCVIAPVIRQ